MKEAIKKIAATLLALLLMIPMGLIADAAPATLSVVTRNVQFPSSDPDRYGTYTFDLINQSGTGRPLFCIAPEAKYISTGTYTHKGALTQAIIDNTTWSHVNGTQTGYAKPTANEIYSILWHAVNTEGLDFDDLTDWQQGGIQMAIKHWREKNNTWGVPAYSGTDAKKAFDLAKKLMADVWANPKTMNSQDATISLSAPTVIMERSGNVYTIAKWTVSGKYDSYSVVKDVGTTTGVTLTKSGNTITATIPAAYLTGAVQVNFKVDATKAISRVDYYTASGYQNLALLAVETSSASANQRFNIINDEGVIEIYKTGDDTGAALQGATFTITNKATGQPYRITTDANGYASTSTVEEGLPLGQYTVTETTFPFGYEAGGYQTSWDVEITKANPVIRIDAVNARMKGHAGVKKTDDAGTPLSGCTFGFYADYLCTDLMGFVTTDENGEAVLMDIPMQTLVFIKEYSTKNEQYVLDDTMYYTYIYPNTTTFANSGNAVINDRKGRVTLTKQDDSGAVLGDGYVFYIYADAACTSPVAVMTTGQDGVAISDWLVAGDYFVKEYALPADDVDHVINDTVYPVTVTKGGTTLVGDNGVVINQRKRGDIFVSKLDSSGHYRAGAGFLLEVSTDGGATWTPITDCRSVGLTDGVLVTDDTGAAVFTDVLAVTGYTYRVTEVQAPDGCSLQAAPVFENALPTTDGHVEVITVVDTPLPRLPMTGDGGFIPVIGGVLLLMGGAALYITTIQSNKKGEETL